LTFGDIRLTVVGNDDDSSAASFSGLGRLLSPRTFVDEADGLSLPQMALASFKR